MKHRFIIPALILFLAVFVFSITGCGGSNKSRSISPEEKEEESTLSLKAKEREAYTEALDTFYERLKAEGTYDQFMAICDYTIMYPPTELFEFYPEHKSEESISVPLDEAAEVIAEVVKPRYDEGQIIYMLSPTQNNLDTLLRGIGETSPYTEPANSEEPIYALYAITKRYASNGTKHVFTYEIPCQVDFTSEVVEYESESRDVSDYSIEEISNLPVSDDEPAEQEDTDDTTEKLDLIDQCLVNYGEWALHYIDDYLETAGLKAAEFSSQVNAAIDAKDLEDLASACHKTINLSYKKDFHPFDNGTYDCTVNRITLKTYHIYCCHSFSTGSDFYLVKCDVASTPGLVYDYIRRNYSAGEPAYYTEYYGGATDHILVGAYMQDGDSTSNALLVKTVPFATVPMNTTRSERMGWSEGGKIGLGISSEGKASIGIDLTETVTHDKTLTYTTTDWKLENSRGSGEINEALFDLDVKGANIIIHKYVIYRGMFRDSDEWDKVELPEAATKELRFNVEWVWEVKKQFWQSRKYIPFMGYAEFNDLFVHGGGQCLRANPFASPHHGEPEKTKIKTKVEPKEIPHDAPPHLYVDKTSITFGGVGGTGGFSLLCSGNWKVESDSDWCSIPQIYQSGSDTGGNATYISFQAAPFNTSGGYDARRAIITATEIRPDGSTGDSIKIEVNQNNH